MVKGKLIVVRKHKYVNSNLPKYSKYPARVYSEFDFQHGHLAKIERIRPFDFRKLRSERGYVSHRFFSYPHRRVSPIFYVFPPFGPCAGRHTTPHRLPLDSHCSLAFILLFAVGFSSVAATRLISA